MKHVFYALYILFYAGAMFVAGLFFGQFMERRWAARERAEAEAAATKASDESLIMDEAPIALSARSHSPLDNSPS